jgi:hypothetical protein
LQIADCRLQIADCRLQIGRRPRPKTSPIGDMEVPGCNLKSALGCNHFSSSGVYSSAPMPDWRLYYGEKNEYWHTPGQCRRAGARGLFTERWNTVSGVSRCDSWCCDRAPYSHRVSITPSFLTGPLIREPKAVFRDGFGKTKKLVRKMCF